MSRQSSIYFRAFLLIVGSSILIAHFTRSTEGVEIQPVFLSGNQATGVATGVSRLTSQLAKERVWKSLSLKRVLSISGIQQAMEIQDDLEGNTFIFDWGDFLIKKFSSQGILSGSFGNGRGNQPGQFINPTGFALTKDGQMWVCDPKGVITHFGSNGEVIKTLSPRTPAMRIVHGDDQRFVIMTTSRGEYLWETYTDSGEFLNEFGRLIEDQPRTGITLVGWLANDRSADFYYAAYYPGILAAYQLNGEPRFVVQTIDPRPLPKIEVTPKGVWKIDHQHAEVSTLSIGAAGDALFLLTETTGSHSERKIIDVYSKHDGSYLYSDKAPEPCERAFFTRDYLYTVNGGTITKWQWQN